MDVFYFFFHLALNLGNQNSSIAFITTNYFLTATGANKLRQDIKTRAIIDNLINFNELKIFESALGQHNMISILRKLQNRYNLAQTCITHKYGIATPQILLQILNSNDKETKYYKIAQENLYDGNDYYIRLEGCSGNTNDPTLRILDSIKTQGTVLQKLCNTKKGIITGCDKVTNKHIRQYSLSEEYQKGDGIFVLNSDTFGRLTLNDFEKSRIRQWFKNSDIVGKYISKTNNILYLIDISYPADKHLNLKLKIPNLLKHLQKYRVILESRKTAANGLDKVLKKGFWWPLESKRKINFDGAKIICPQRSYQNTFSYNEIPWYASADVYFITEKDKSICLKYVLALLNSKLYYLWLYHRGKRKGEMLELYQKPLSEIPIKKISEDGQKSFIEIVDKIMLLHNPKIMLKIP